MPTARSNRSAIVALALLAVIGANSAAASARQPGGLQPEGWAQPSAKRIAPTGPQGGEVFGSSGDSASSLVIPPGFSAEVVWTGLVNPTAIRFASDGRVFVSEKSGLIKVFDGVLDPTPSLFADLRTNVYNFWDRGLLGLAVPPDIAANPYVYVLYAHDAVIGGQAPLWGAPGISSDPCPTPPGPTADGCLISGRLSKIPASGGPEQVLIEDWCQQYPSHSTGALAFGPDGALYATGGDGASFTFTDWGQDGSPVNPCADPINEGGALRSQDLRTSADPTSLDGAVLRVDPDTGQALPTNPLYGGSVVDDDRIIAHGLRNPFRFTVRPGIGDLWIADVGWNTWEEISRVSAPADAAVENFGWPCHEGADRQGGYDAANLPVCESMYAQPGAVTAPFFAYNHSDKVVAGESCPTGSSSVAGLAFYPGGAFPDTYDGALFFSDYSRDCIWVMQAGPGGIPDPTTRQTFVAGAANPVDVQIGPDGNLYYVDFDGGAVRRIRYSAANQPPVAVIDADPPSGPAPLSVDLSGLGSFDLDAGDVLTYGWDLDADGQYDDATAAELTYVFDAPGVYSVGLEVDDGEDSDTASVTINAGNDPPQAFIDAPAGATWQVGETITFSGGATDPQQEFLPPSALTWSLVMHHCPSTCHTHPIQDFPGVSGGTFVAPDHEYPSHLELLLTGTDAQGLQSTASVLTYPRTVDLTFQSAPTGLQIAVGSEVAATPFTRTVIVGSTNSMSAPSPQTLGETVYEFSSWSDGGQASHLIVAPDAPSTFTAAFTPAPNTAVAISDFAFRPQVVTVSQNETVRWRNDGPSSHTVTDRSGMGLFDSGLVSTGATYDRAFPGAGKYQYRCTVHRGMTGWVRIRVIVTPPTGNLQTTFQVVWAAEAPAADFVYDIQIDRPGPSPFVDWLSGQIGSQAPFVADAGAGSYRFRARLRQVSTGKTSQWAPPTKVKVTVSAQLGASPRVQ